jgi:hypothetical protein
VLRRHGKFAATDIPAAVLGYFIAGLSGARMCWIALRWFAQSGWW